MPADALIDTAADRLLAAYPPDAPIPVPGDLPLASEADGLSHGAFVLGSGIPADGLGQMRDAAYRLRLDGETMLDGRGGHPGGDPAALLVAMINAHIQATDEGIAAGEVITTGTFDGVVEMHAGQRASLAFAGIGAVELTLD